jgi:anti-anti-sigma factor
MAALEDPMLHGLPDASPGFEVTVARDPLEVRVRVMGDLDLLTVSTLDIVLDRLAAEGHDRLLLDLDGVEFMDASGLAAVVRAQRSARRHAHRLAIRYSSRQVHRLLELTNMLDYLTFE